MEAATVAEESQLTSEFWSTHDLLYSGGHLDQDTIRQAQLSLDHDGVRPDAAATARDVVEADASEAAELGIQGTPTFALCCPSGIVRRIDSLDQVPGFIKHD